MLAEVGVGGATCRGQRGGGEVRDRIGSGHAWQARRRSPSGRSVLRASFLVVAVAAIGSSFGPASGDGFHTGDAQASADTFTLNIKAANAAIGFTYGRSLAAYQDKTGTSEGRALDLGALPVIFTPDQCDGTPGLLDSKQLPPLTRADSSEEGSNNSRRVQVFTPGVNGEPMGPSTGSGRDGKPLPASRPSRHLQRRPHRHGGRTGSRPSSRTRSVKRTTDADQLRVMGGCFQPATSPALRSSSTGSFPFTSATVLGIPGPGGRHDRSEGFKYGEQLLAPLGVVWSCPVEVRDDGVKVTPMGFGWNPPFGTGADPFSARSTPGPAVAQDLVAAATKTTTLTIVDLILRSWLRWSDPRRYVDVPPTTPYSIPPIEPMPRWRRRHGPARRSWRTTAPTR